MPFSFIRKFYIFISFFLNRKPLKKAERPQVNKPFALLMINSQHIYSITSIFPCIFMTNHADDKFGE